MIDELIDGRESQDDTNQDNQDKVVIIVTIPDLAY